MLAAQLLALDEGGTESGLAEGVQNGQPGPGHSEQTEIARRQEGGEGEVDDHCRHLPADLLNHRPDHRRSATSRKRHSSWASVRSLSKSRATRSRPPVPRRAIRAGSASSSRTAPTSAPGSAGGTAVRSPPRPRTPGFHRSCWRPPACPRPWLPPQRGCRRPEPRVSEPRPALRRRRTWAGLPRERPPPGRPAPASGPPRSPLPPAAHRKHRPR